MPELVSQAGWVGKLILSASGCAWFLIVMIWLRLWGIEKREWRVALERVRCLESGKKLTAVEQERLLGIDRALSTTTPRDLRRLVLPRLQDLEARFAGGLDLVGRLASILPLLGLLGTVLGVVGTFDALLEQRSARIDAMAEGIARALITTQMGLVAAVPVLLAHGYLDAKLRGLFARARLLMHRAEAALGVEEC